MLCPCLTTTVIKVYDRSSHPHLYPLICLHEFCLFFFHDLVLVSRSALISLHPLYCFCLNFLLKSGQAIEPWQRVTCATRRKWWRVPQELAWVCRWAGCWPAKLISHSPGIHNASRVTMGTKQKVREGNSERGREILEGKYSRTASVSLGCRFWQWRPAVHLGLFIHSPHFNTLSKGKVHWRTRSQLPM